MTATSGSWTNWPSSYTYQWQGCDASGANCTDIGDATNSTYALTSADVNNTVRVVVTASNAGGSTSADSAPTSVITDPPPPLPPPPANATLPTIGGTAQPGNTLTASTGTWTNSPTLYSYQWQRCQQGVEGSYCAYIPAATSSGYTVQAADLGDTLLVAVTASNAGGQSTAISEQTATVTGGA